MVMQNVAAADATAPAELPPDVGGMMPGAGAPPESSPAELQAVLQQQQGLTPEMKRQQALQKLLRLRAAIDALIRILQGQQGGQPPAWMGQGAAPTSPGGGAAPPQAPGWQGGA